MGRYSIGVLTSSRADFSIYLPVLNKFKADDSIDLKIIAFGSHTSSFHGETKESIRKSGFDIAFEVNTLPEKDSALDLVKSQGDTFKEFAQLWENQNFDLVFCLGDRYEMYAAVLSALPFGVKMAHLHGGETSLGAIDNVYRHSISLASQLHFVSCEDHKTRLEEILDETEHIYVSGAPSLDNVAAMQLMNTDEFNTQFDVDLGKPTILATIHPETVAADKNEAYITSFIAALDKIEHQILITKANADTMGNMINAKLETFASTKQNVHLRSSLGPKGYFSALKHCKLVIGNSSSGLIETASYDKYCLNIGDRQLGRKQGKNIINVPFDTEAITEAIEKTLKLGNFEGENIFYLGGAAPIIHKHTLEFLQNND